MITDPIEINQRFVKLPEVVVLGIDDPEDGPFRARIESARTPQGCPLCGVLAHVKDREVVELVDPPPRGHRTRLIGDAHGNSPESLIEIPHPVRAVAGR